MKTDLVVAIYIFNDKGEVLLVRHKDLNLWLPVGGHIERNETPDEAIAREAKEEINLKVEILGGRQIGRQGNVKKELAAPFYVNVHSVGDHDHCCLFYIGRALNAKKIKINQESEDFAWFSENDLYEKIVPLDVRGQALTAGKIYKNYENYPRRKNKQNKTG